MKVLILADNPNWIVNRNCDAMIKHMPEVEFIKVYDQQISVEEFERLAKDVDLVHFLSWEKIDKFREVAKRFKVILTIKSHRYNKESVRNFLSICKAVTCVNPDICEEIEQLGFKNPIYIPDGIDDNIMRIMTTPIIGFAGRSQDYKGDKMIEQVCSELGFIFLPAYGNISPENMYDYYGSLDCYVCASVAEGFSTSVMECLALNIPVIMTDVGVPKMFNIIRVDRSIEGIKKGLLMLFGRKYVNEFTWDNICKQYEILYGIINERI